MTALREMAQRIVIEYDPEVDHGLLRVEYERVADNDAFGWRRRMVIRSMSKPGEEAVLPWHEASGGDEVLWQCAVAVVDGTQCAEAPA